MNVNKSSRGHVLVAVTGGIAAYKAVEVCSQLIKRDFLVKVMMTSSAKEFVTPLAFETITQNPVASEMFTRTTDWDVEHISLARWADLILVCPATANIIGKLANGICDDFVSTTLLASKADCMFAPAMNVAMYEHPFFQNNLKKLDDFGYKIISPSSGRLACGEEGLGRLANLEDILDKVDNYFGTECYHNKNNLDANLDSTEGISESESYLTGKTVLITAGATREMIDPVRFLSNPSTGKMGYAVAQAALDRGANVILVTAATSLDAPKGSKVISVVTAQEMYEKVMENLEQSDVIIKTAAVSDYRPKEVHTKKIKKDKISDEMELKLVRNPDILKAVGEQKGKKVVIGFAAETNDIIENAQKKIRKKNADMLVVNDISSPDAGFEKDINTVKIIYKNGTIKELSTMSKTRLGEIIIKETERILQNRPT